MHLYVCKNCSVSEKTNSCVPHCNSSFMRSICTLRYSWSAANRSPSRTSFDASILWFETAVKNRTGFAVDHSCSAIHSAAHSSRTDIPTHPQLTQSSRISQGMCEQLHPSSPFKRDCDLIHSFIAGIPHRLHTYEPGKLQWSLNATSWWIPGRSPLEPRTLNMHNHVHLDKVAPWGCTV